MVWLVGIIAFIAGLIIGWRLTKRMCDARMQEMATAAAAAPSAAMSFASTAPAIEQAPVAVDPDDLTKIEGIGPRIAGLLNDDGIFTYGNLSAESVDRLKGILNAAGSRYQMHDPGSWPEQANLAAKGLWAELEDLQERLDGGK